MHSCVYLGSLTHRRLMPRVHAFRYRLLMLYLDLDELGSVFQGRWLWSIGRPNVAWLRRADYLGEPGVPLEEAVRRRVAEATGHRPTGAIRMLTHLRMFGHCFNPLTVYYCFDAAGRPEALVAEITNTPWNERHSYVLTAAAGEGTAPPACSPRPGELRARFAKAFHVSPFMDMDMEYLWRFGAPDDDLEVYMSNRKSGRTIFDAHLELRRKEIGAAALARALLHWPPMTLKVHAGIYWQALRLWLKRVPVYAHPRARAAARQHHS
jgi:uncharacterized protein